MPWLSSSRCRPFGYNPVELSRFAEGHSFGISIARRLAPFGSSPTLSPLGTAFARSLLPILVPESLSTLRSRRVSPVLSASADGIPVPPLTTVVRETLEALTK